MAGVTPIGTAMSTLPPTPSSISPARRRLLRLMQTLNFGRIERLPVRGGDPVLDPAPVTVVEIKFAAENGPRPETRLSDFMLKRQVADLFALLDAIGDGELLILSFRHGLPFTAERAL